MQIYEFNFLVGYKRWREAVEMTKGFVFKKNPEVE